MPDPSFPLVNRGPEALQALLSHDEPKAAEQVALLTLSELTTLSATADQLAALARQHLNKVCETCKAPITWHPREPGLAQGWRHDGTAASWGFEPHRATPPVPSKPCPRCGKPATLGRFDVCAPCAALMGWDPECEACRVEGEGREASVAHVQSCAGATTAASNPRATR